MKRTWLVLLPSIFLVGCGTSSVTLPVSDVAVSDVVESLPVAVTQVSPRETAPEKTESPRYTVHKMVAPVPQPVIPSVLLTGDHAKLCKVEVGDTLSAMSLPRLGGEVTSLASLLGKQATVVLFWHSDRWMARTALIDMQRDVAKQFDAKQVAVVGIAVEQSQGSVQASLNQAKASFPQLLDTDGQAFATVGSVALPRLYVLDPAGKITWFDIEYSEGTRRELWQTLQVLTADAE